MQNDANRQNQTSLLCSLLERYLDLNPDKNAAQAIFTVTRFRQKADPMYRHHGEQNRYTTNSDIIKGFQTYFSRYDINTVNNVMSDSIVIKLNSEDWNNFVGDLNSD